MSLFDSMKPGSGSPSADDIKVRFRNHVQLKAYDDNLIDREEERSLLETGVGMGLTIEDAGSLIREVARDKGYGVERDLDEEARQQLAVAAADKKGVEKNEFEEAVRRYLAGAKGAMPEARVKSKLKQIVLENSWKVKEGGMFGPNWFSDIA